MPVHYYIDEIIFLSQYFCNKPLGLRALESERATGFSNFPDIRPVKNYLGRTRTPPASIFLFIV